MEIQFTLGLWTGSICEGFGRPVKLPKTKDVFCTDPVSTLIYKTISPRIAPLPTHAVLCANSSTYFAAAVPVRACVSRVVAPM